MCVIIVGEMSKRTMAATFLLLTLGACSQPPHPEPMPSDGSFPSAQSKVSDRASDVVGSSPTSPEPDGHPTPAATPSRFPRPTESSRVSSRRVTGRASTYGDGYEGLFAMPVRLGGRGEHVLVCSLAAPNRCLDRTSNDVGPVASLHRVADLDATDFNYLCACRWQVVGVQDVTITWLN